MIVRLIIALSRAAAASARDSWAKRRLTPSGLRIALSRRRNQPPRFSKVTSLGPYRARRTSASSSGSPSTEVCKRLQSSASSIRAESAREFEPQFIRKGQRRFGGFDSKIIAMYAQGMTVREIQAFLQEQYKVEVSADLISTVTDSVLEDVVEWQNRPLERMYSVVFFDALRVKIRDEGTVKNKAIYLALGIQRDGTKEVLGMWIQQSGGAKFWLAVMNELKHRGVEDILIAVIDGLKGFPEAITAVFPETRSRLVSCI